MSAYSTTNALFPLEVDIAESVDVSNAIANAVATITSSLVGQTFTIPEPLDAATYGPQTVPPITVSVNRPLQRELDQRLEAGEATISVETDHVDLTVTQYQNEGRRHDLLEQQAVTLTAAPAPPVGAGSAWTLGGVPAVDNVVGIQSGALGATYTVVAGDTLTSVAAGLAAACVGAGISGSGSGATITTDAGATIRFGAPSTWLIGVSRTARHFDVLIWSPDNYLRDYLASKIEAIFVNGAKLAMPDGSEAVVIAKIGTLDSNEAEKDNLFLARTRWQIEFTTTRMVTKAPVVAITVDLALADDAPSSLGPILATNL
jgi:hypothetical protein